MSALMGASGGTDGRSQALPQLTFDGSDELNSASQMPQDPLAALMASFAGGAGSGFPGGGFPPQAGGGASPFGDMGMGMPFGPGGAQMQAEKSKPRSKLHAFLPALHFFSVLSLLAYFVLWVEPSMYSVVGGTASARWRRWAQLGWENPYVLDTPVGSVGWGVQLVPFFWAFTTLQIALHSLRIFSGYDRIQPPALLALALPHLPPPIPTLITTGFKYFNMGGLFLNDVSTAVVGVGLVVWLAGFISETGKEHNLIS